MKKGFGGFDIVNPVNRIQGKVALAVNVRSYDVDELNSIMNLTYTKRGATRPFGIIYSALNKKNGKRYVGITRANLRLRITQHKVSSVNPFGRALRKYGESAFRIEVIDFAESPDELFAKERYWIKNLNCMSPRGYNLTSGGEHAYDFSPEVGRRISASKIGVKRPDVKPEDLSGKRFGRLVAVGVARHKPVYWKCICDCGREHIVVNTLLKSGKCKSCGCLRREVTRARHQARRDARGS